MWLLCTHQQIHHQRQEPGPAPKPDQHHLQHGASTVEGESKGGGWCSVSKVQLSKGNLNEQVSSSSAAPHHEGRLVVC